MRRNSGLPVSVCRLPVLNYMLYIYKLSFFIIRSNLYITDLLTHQQRFYYNSRVTHCRISTVDAAVYTSLQHILKWTCLLLFCIVSHLWPPLNKQCDNRTSRIRKRLQNSQYGEFWVISMHGIVIPHSEFLTAWDLHSLLTAVSTLWWLSGLKSKAWQHRWIMEYIIDIPVYQGCYCW